MRQHLVFITSFIVTYAFYRTFQSVLWCMYKEGISFPREVLLANPNTTHLLTSNIKISFLIFIVAGDEKSALWYKKKSRKKMKVVISYSKSVTKAQPGNVSLEIFECRWNIKKEISSITSCWNIEGLSIQKVYWKQVWIINDVYSPSLGLQKRCHSPVSQCKISHGKKINNTNNCVMMGCFVFNDIHIQ